LEIPSVASVVLDFGLESYKGTNLFYQIYYILQRYKNGEIDHIHRALMPSTSSIKPDI
jgi:hypothetical protein